MGSSIRKTKPEKPSSSLKQVKQTPIRDYVSWFEIPALDIERASGFYNEIYNIKMEVTHMTEFVMALFPVNKGIGGAVVVGPGCVPSNVGPLIYLNGGNDLDNVLLRIEAAGGRVVMPKTFIGEDAGYFALFIDTEGNRLALHSKN